MIVLFFSFTEKSAAKCNATFTSMKMVKKKYVWIIKAFLSQHPNCLEPCPRYFCVLSDTDGLMKQSIT